MVPFFCKISFTSYQGKIEGKMYKESLIGNTLFRVLIKIVLRLEIMESDGELNPSSALYYP